MISHTVIIFLFISLLISPIFLVRWMRWLAILQQKEYRLDRLWAFFHSEEGRAELVRIFPKKNDFTRIGMKRPHFTQRVVMIGCLSGLALSVKSVVIIWVASQTFGVQAFGRWGIGFGLLYLFVPLAVIIGSFPSAFISRITTWKMLKKAQRRLQESQPLIIGFGGSYGKTSTKHLVHHFLSQKFSVFVTPRSFNTKYSVAQSICTGYQDQKIALLEYGTYTRGEIASLTRWFPPRISVETGFTPQHLSIFGSRKNSILAESELVAALPTDGVVFCNGADPGAVEICQVGAVHNHVKAIMYAGKNAQIQLEEVKVNQFGQLNLSWQDHKIETQLIGRQYLVNLQAAMVISQYLGLSTKEVQTAARTFRPNDSFIQGKILQNGAYLIDDGRTTNPMGFAAALDLVEELPYTKKILITAGMIDLGEESAQIHAQLATKAKKVGLEVVHLGVDGRAEFADVFGQMLITDVIRAMGVILDADQQTVVLIEGNLPKVLEDTIERLTKQMI